MNRHHRRAEAAQARTAGTSPDRAEAIRLAIDHLANIAADTATGATIMHLDGTATYVSAADARTLHGNGPARGQA